MATTTRITSIEGNHQRLDGGAMFGNAPRPVWEKWAPPDPTGRIDLACRALLIEHGSKKILCETGIGAFFEPGLAERYGVQEPTSHLLLDHMKQKGIDPDEIDFVILSHLHFDHAGGLLPKYADIQAGQKQLLFKRAQYVVGREAWERALKPHARDRASFIPELTSQLEQSGRLMIVDGDHLPGCFADRLFFRKSFGHTPGHLHTGFRGDQQTVFFCGDLIPGRAWIHLPITMGYDRFPEMLIDEKANLYETAVRDHWLLFFTHDPEVAAAHVRRDEKGKFVPRDEIKVLNQSTI